MPTFIGSGGGSNNSIADAVKNVMQQTSPLNLAHASLYGGQLNKLNEDVALAQLKRNALEQLRANGILDPNDRSQLGAAVVSGLVDNLAAANRLRTASVYGAADPRTDAATVGAGGAFTTTAMGQGRDLAAQAARTAATNATSIKTTQMQGDVSRANNADTNATSIKTTDMQGGVSRANNADTIAAENERSRLRLQSEAERALTEQDNKLVEGVEADGITPGWRRAGDIRKGAAPGFRPSVTLDQSLGNATVPAAPAAGAPPAGVLQGGAVPSQIPQAPSGFIPQPPAPVSPVQRVQVPLAHDLTNTVEVPQQAPQLMQPPSIVQPSLTPPASLTGGAPSRLSNVINGLDPRVANMKGLRYPPMKTYIDVGGKRVGTSADEGRTITVNGQQIPNDGTFQPAGPETGIAETRTALAQGAVKPFMPADPRVGQIFQSAIKPGVGGIAGFAQQDINTILGSTGLAALIPGGEFGADQNAARQRLDIFNEQMKKALLGGRASEAGVKEQSRVVSLLPSTGIFTNPQTEAGKVVQLYGALMEQNRALVQRLQRPEASGADFNRLRSMLDENETALKMLTDPAWATKFTGQTVGGGAGAPAQPAGDAVDFNQRPGGPTPPGAGFKILGVRDK